MLTLRIQKTVSDIGPPRGKQPWNCVFDGAFELSLKMEMY